jgi:hypothetical protein
MHLSEQEDQRLNSPCLLAAFQEALVSYLLLLNQVEALGRATAVCLWCGSFARSEPQASREPVRLVFPCSIHGAVSVASSICLKRQYLNNKNRLADRRFQNKTPMIMRGLSPGNQRDRHITAVNSLPAWENYRRMCATLDMQVY